MQALIDKPPYTNRGATRQKENLTALIDWCQITVKGVDIFKIIEDILRIPSKFMELHGKKRGLPDMNWWQSLTTSKF